MSQYIPSIVAAVTALVTIFTPEIQQVVVNHPAWASTLAAIYAIMTHLMPSPVAK